MNNNQNISTYSFFLNEYTEKSVDNWIQFYK